MEDGPNTKRRRHGKIALRRQKELARWLFYVNVAIAVIWLLTANDWHLGLSGGVVVALIACGVVFVICIGLAANGIGGVRRFLRAADQGNDDDDDEPWRSESWIADRRYWFYYAGVWADLFALALLVWTTGGLDGSPLVAILVAFVLTGMQLSRERDQAAALLASGVGVAVFILVVSPPMHPPDPAPSDLATWLVMLALGGGGVLTLNERFGKIRRRKKAASVDEPATP